MELVLEDVMQHAEALDCDCPAFENRVERRLSVPQLATESSVVPVTQPHDPDLNEDDELETEIL
jgi:hypothetical protein